MDDLIERLRVEPTASHFLRVGDLEAFQEALK